MRRVYQGDQVYLITIKTLAEITLHESGLEDLYILKEPLFTFTLHFPVAKTFPYKEEFNEKIAKLFEGGKYCKIQVTIL